MLRGLQFEPWVAPVHYWRNRMDVACFLGFTRRRAGAGLPISVVQWLRQQGWIDAPGQPSSDQIDADGAGADALDHMPVPIDDWPMFEQIFEVRSGLVGSDTPARVPGYLAAAVRSFFAQGGRRCVVIPIEHPSDLYLRSTTVRRAQALTELVPALGGEAVALEPFDRSAWRGIGLLHGLDDVTLLCMPDLPWLVGQVPDWLTPDEPPPFERAEFFECADELTPAPERVRPAPISIGRCDEAEYASWRAAVHAVAGFLARYRRDAQLLAALPLPTHSSRANRDLVEALLAWEVIEPVAFAGPRDEDDRGRFVQLVYPWVGWTGSRGLPENLEPGDGVFAGLIARTTLLAGAFRTVSGRELYDIDRFEPRLSRQQQEGRPVADEAPLIERVSLLGATPDQFEALSDVTTTRSPGFDLANIQRLHAVWIRALEQAGESFVFESSNEQTWADVRRQLEGVGLALYRRGALRGASSSQAFYVRCDRSTMSQRDIDGGRLIAEIRYRPAAPLELIRVSLALSENREVTVVAESAEALT